MARDRFRVLDEGSMAHQSLRYKTVICSIRRLNVRAFMLWTTGRLNKQSSLRPSSPRFRGWPQALLAPESVMGRFVRPTDY